MQKISHPGADSLPTCGATMNLNVGSILQAGILAIMENYVIVIIQYVLLMNGAENRDYCCHTAFRRIIAMHEW
jgi:hypothetical protein